MVTGILDAGWALFLERGISAVTVEAIAARANVSKATFYKHFADKATLFEAAVLREMKSMEAAQLPTIRPHSPIELRADLFQFGVGLMNFMVSSPAVDFYKALSAELARHKFLAQRFYDLGPGRTRANLMELLRRNVQSGELDIANLEEAAEQLIGMWQGITNFQLSLNIESDQIRSSIPARIEAGLNVFLAAYSSKKPVLKKVQVQITSKKAAIK